MAQMQRLRGRPSARVEIKLLPPLVGIEDVAEVAVGEEDAAAEEDVRRAAGEAGNAVDEGLVQALAAELVDQLIVINFASLFGRHLPRRHDLVLLLVLLVSLVLHCCRQR